MFSVCIPNFNYQKYLGSTLESVIAQTNGDFEILVSDNASTDQSVALVQSYQATDERIQLSVNRCNVGFAGNLAKAASMASRPYMVMLSSDDLMLPSALATYARIIDALGPSSQGTIFSSTVNVIDGEGLHYDHMGVDWKQWAGAERNDKLSKAAGADVWLMPADRLLRNSLKLMRTPFHFATTTYPKALHDAVEGYSQGGIINPDKRFAWALLGEAEQAIVVEAPLFSYRVHQNNQGSQQLRSGALKHITDEYVATFSLPESILTKAKLSRHQVVEAFIEHDIALRGLLALAEGQPELARRTLQFGMAAYPDQIRANLKARALRWLLASGPVGVFAAAKLKKTAMQRWKAKVQAEQALNK